MNIDEKKKIILFKKALKILGDEDWELMPSIIYFKIYRFMKTATGIDDPYLEVKETWNKKAQEFFDKIRFKLSDESLYTYLKLALAANIIDFGALETFDIEYTVNNVIKKEPMLNDYEIFLNRAENSESILYLMDNAGEVFFDFLFLRKLIQEYPNIRKIGIAAREEALVNDVTLDDLKKEELAKLISPSHYEMIGLPVCKNKFLEYEKKAVFQKIFNKYSIVISKGQGNFELFYKYRNIFFALIVKCKPISNILKVPIGETAFFLNIK